MLLFKYLCNLFSTESLSGVFFFGVSSMFSRTRDKLNIISSPVENISWHTYEDRAAGRLRITGLNCFTLVLVLILCFSTLLLESR